MMSLRPLSLLLACALILQALLPFLVLTQESTTAKALSAKILICSGASARWVAWQDIETEGHADNAPHGSQHEPSCMLCIPASSHAFADVTAPLIPATLENLLFTHEVNSTAPHLRAERFAAEHPSRAPPLG